MQLQTKAFQDESDLKNHLKTHTPTFYTSSKTSTVIPYDKLETEISEDLVIGDLSRIPASMKLNGDNLVLRGAVNWQEADQFLKSHGRAIMTSPTEQLALVLAGVATSCTGERCFAFGNLRKQIIRLKYFDFDGIEHELHSKDKFPEVQGLKDYQDAFLPYNHFKNGPFPRFQMATDLMIGTEGQLGVVSEVEMLTASHDDMIHVFLLLPRWEDDYRPHLEIFNSVQSYRGDVISCELLDSNCMNYLKPDERLGKNQDIILMEIKADQFEKVYESCLTNLELTEIDNVFEVSSAKFHHVRASVPRAVFEENSRMGVKKMGTDCQVNCDDYSKLFDFYRECSSLKVRYNLFGHFGDAHLHFNFMPSTQDIPNCQTQFEKLYQRILELKGSPFAEHGIGLLKQKFIKSFVSETQRKVFSELKKKHDPKNQFFPQGFMQNI
jgi:FAD/FMN-containing dehydrogenase